METPYLARLKAAGVELDQVDMVMCTHLHVDHVGWNTRLENGKWVPTFKNAKYVFSRTDYDHYLKVDTDPKTAPANAGSFRDLGAAGRRGGTVATGRRRGSARREPRGRARASATRPARSPSSSNRAARRRCSAAISCITHCRSIIRNGTASPAPRPSVRARAGARHWSIAPARARV